MAKIEVNGRQATHYCTVCGALWATRDPAPNLPDGGWSQISDLCGKCRDNVALNDQVKPLHAPVEDFGLMYVEAQPDRAPAPRVKRSRIITITMDIDVTDAPDRVIYQDVEDILVHALRHHDTSPIGKDIVSPGRYPYAPNSYRIDAHYAKDGKPYQIGDDVFGEAPSDE